MSTEQQRRTVQDSLTRLRELFTDACKSWDLQVPSMADPLDQESANRLHPFGPVNIDKLRQDISATTKSVNHILEEYETSGLADAEKIGQPADAALRKFVTSIKDEANISQAVSRFSKAIQDCQDISRMPSASKGDSIGFDKRLDLLRKLAEELGLATYVDASGGEETGITTLTLSGTVIVVDIDLHPTSEASKIKVQYAIEVDQDPRIDKLLTENLKHQDYEALGKNLKALAIIDRFNKTYSPVDFFTLLRLLSNDFKTICSHELEAAMDDLQKTLLQGHGMPMAHYKRPGPNIAYWGSKADLVDVDWFSLREAVQLGECSMEMPRLHWMWITTEEQTNDIVFLPPAHSSYLVQASGGEDVEQAADPNVATIQELIFPHFVIAQRFHQPLPGGPNTAPARFVAYLDPPVIATADIAQQISLLVGQTTDMTIDDSTAKHDNEQDTAKELTLEELYISHIHRPKDKASLRDLLRPNSSWVKTFPDGLPEQHYSFIGHCHENVRQIDRIPFHHPSQLFGVMQCLRQQLLYQTLIQSCFNQETYPMLNATTITSHPNLLQFILHDQDTTSAHPSKVTVEVASKNAPNQITITLIYPGPSLLLQSFDIQITRMSPIQPIIHVYPTKLYPDQDKQTMIQQVFHEAKMTQVLQLSESIPILIRWLWKRMEAMDPALLHPNKRMRIKD